MPGARLTHEDRRQIAAWLAEGLGYAEIARRLGRPTSTISREVARNGDPGDYRPDRAQQAATRRARQRTRPGHPPTTDGRPAEPVRDFVEQFATLLAATGLPRMTARVFVCLLTSDSGSATAADLVRRLRVSPASVSKSIGYLERMDLVVRRPDPGRRRERYVIVDDVWLRAWRTDTGAHAEVADAAQRGTEIFGAGTPAGTRLGRDEPVLRLAQRADERQQPRRHHRRCAHRARRARPRRRGRPLARAGDGRPGSADTSEVWPADHGGAPLSLGQPASNG